MAKNSFRLCRSIPRSQFFGSSRCIFKVAGGNNNENTTTASKTIEALSEIFSRNGLPQQIVSDNGPQFISKEFCDFENNNGITHIFSAPYHAASNGLAERFVETLKHSLSALSETFPRVSQRLTTFLLAYRNAPHATTQEAPDKLMHGSLLRTRLDLLKPDLRKKVQENQTS